MQSREKVILEFMKDKSYVPMKAKEIASVLMVPKSEYEEFKNVINKLENSFKIRKKRKQPFCFSLDGDLRAWKILALKTQTQQIIR